MPSDAGSLDSALSAPPSSSRGVSPLPSRESVVSDVVRGNALGLGAGLLGTSGVLLRTDMPESLVIALYHAAHLPLFEVIQVLFLFCIALMCVSPLGLLWSEQAYTSYLSRVGEEEALREARWVRGVTLLFSALGVAGGIAFAGLVPTLLTGAGLLGALYGMRRWWPHPSEGLPLPAPER